VPRPLKKEKPLRQPVFTGRAFVIWVLTALVAFWAGIWYAQSNRSPKDDEDFDVFWQSWDLLESQFYYDLPEDTELTHAAIQGLFSRAGDRYTFFMLPSDAEISRERTAGEFGGIGAYVSQNNNGQLIISRPFEGLPAEQAGLKANDVILEINGTDITGWAFEDAVDLLRGDIGSAVTLVIFRPATDERLSIKITRARIEIPVTDTALYGSVGYVTLSSFNQRATTALEEDIRDLQEQGAQALILDLRSNPGGLLDQAVSVSDLFLDGGLVVTQRNRQEEEKSYSADSGDLAEDIPLVVLIDGGSASASEVVAGALRDHERAVLIGQQSFGKGSVQYVYDMNDGSQVHVTTAVWFTPNNTLINGQGLTPDVVVTIPEDAPPDTDPFIEVALDYFEQNGIESGRTNDGE
jgi:carboxyl-terminal processing protease